MERKTYYTVMVDGVPVRKETRHKADLLWRRQGKPKEKELRPIPHQLGT